MSGYKAISVEVTAVMETAGTAAPRGFDHEIRGTVTANGEPAKRLVTAVDRNALVRRQTVMAASDGTYRIPFIKPNDGPFLLLALDWPGRKGGGYNAAVSDQVFPVPMEE